MTDTFGFALNQPDPTVSLVETQYVSQFAMDINGINIYVAGVLTDADGDDVAIIAYTADGTEVWTQPATRVSTGIYQIQFTSGQTANPGFYTLAWNFTISSVAQQILTWIEVGASNPAYDTLQDPFKTLIDSCWIRFADTFDSPQGGPHLQTYFQSNFSRGRLAQLLRIAVGHLNTMAQPYTTFSVEGPPYFPLAQWGPLLEQRLYIETIKHLIRSYVEQPSPTNIQISRMDRRDYMDRWQKVLDNEQIELRSQMDIFKISMMGLGRPSVLVSGGVYGTFGPTRLPGSAAARARFYSRFY